MGKRSQFKRLPRDFYATPDAAITPLLPHLKPGTRFVEPCAGDGCLLRFLESRGHLCEYAFDIEPQAEDIDVGDALTVRLMYADDLVCITNPPWSRDFLHPFIENWRVQMPTWVLCDADWMHTVQAAPFMPFCARIVSIGRVKWIAGSKMTGKDNCCWYQFAASRSDTRFHGRAQK